jgi:hypothetical protein
MVTGSCHCGAVRIEVPAAPEWVGSCNRMIALHHCPVCACFTDWRSTGESYGRVGVNARLLDGFAVTKAGPTFDGAPIEVRFMDNADPR